MPVFHVTMFFSQPPRWGWVEQFWWEGINERTALAAAVDLAQARFTILGSGVNLFRVRVSVPNIPRAGLSAQIVGSTLPRLARPGPECLEVRLLGTGSPPHRRSYALGGLPVNSLTLTGDVADFAPWIGAAARAWLGRLLQGGWRLLVNQPIGPVVPVLGLTVADAFEHDLFGGPLRPPERLGQPQLLWVGLDGPIPTNAFTVRLWGIQTLPKVKRLAAQVNGERPILDTFEIGVYVEGSTYGITETSGGKAQFYASNFSAISSFDPVALVARARGPAKAPAADSLLEGVYLPNPPLAGWPLGAPPPDLNPPPILPTVHTYQTAQDMVAEVFNGYGPAGASPNPKLGIAQATNQPVDTWVVWVSGVDVGGVVDNYELWVNSLPNYVGIEDPYTDWVEATVRANVPAGSRIFWAGHSMGGMSAQWCRRKIDQGKGWNGPNLMGFGTAVFNSPYEGFQANIAPITFYSPRYTSATGRTNAVYFAFRNDPVMWLSPGGFYAWLKLLLLLKSGPAGLVALAIQSYTPPVWQVLIHNPPDFEGNLFQLHMSYPIAPALDEWNWQGLLDEDKKLPPLTTGPVTRFDYPPD